MTLLVLANTGIQMQLLNVANSSYQSFRTGGGMLRRRTTYIYRRKVLIRFERFTVKYLL